MKVEFFSSCPEFWGGSEELWSSAAVRLAGAGLEVSVLKTGVQWGHPKIRGLLNAGCRVADLRAINYPWAYRCLQRILPSGWQRPWAGTPLDWHLRRHWRSRPQLAVVSQGENFDGVHLAEMCRVRNVPYLLISQKASDCIWPDDLRREVGRRVYRAARNCYFVSNHNRRLTEEQLGFALPRARIVANPCLVGQRQPVPWPPAKGEWKLACVARLWLLDKGQDLLFRVLALPKWRDRPLSVTLYGSGVHEQGLKGMAGYLGLSRVHFAGQYNDIEDCWRHHHALILPSRAEGLPLAAIEAMMCGRPCILTPVGGNRELLGADPVGYLTTGLGEKELDEALEQAWQEREQWFQLGLRSRARVQEYLQGDPEEIFHQMLLEDLCL